MKRSLLLLLVGFLLVNGCASEQQNDKAGVPSGGGKTVARENLDFLNDIPSLNEVSLKMSETEFLGILKRQKLDYRRSVTAEQITYSVRPKAHAVVMFGFRDGRCTGIQRLQD